MLSDLAPPPEPGTALPTAAELAAHLAARLCHDLIGPVGAIVSGLDLVEDPQSQDMRDEAMNLIGASARKVVAVLSFARMAYGAAASSQPLDPGQMQDAARGLYAHARAELDWSIAGEALPRPVGRILLNLAQLGLAALPMGGVARLAVEAQDGRTVAILAAQGARARLAPELKAGLAGEPPGEALAGRWVQAYYLSAIVADAGGRIETAVEDGLVTVRAVLP
jgi:histidine phosphotransferase ChpT